MADYNGEEFSLTPLLIEGPVAAVAAEPFESTAGGPPAVVTYYVNRVWDTVAVGFVRWTTTPLPDPTGASYPGPGVWGVNTSDYCVERVYEA